MHNESEHKSKEKTYQKIADRYWWSNQWKRMKKYVQSCDVCQRRKNIRKKKALHFTYISTWWFKIDVDCIHMSTTKKKRKIMIARCDLSKEIKTWAIDNFEVKTIIKFFWKKVFCRYDCVNLVVMNENSKNKKLIAKLLRRY